MSVLNDDCEIFNLLFPKISLEAGVNVLVNDILLVHAILPSNVIHYNRNLKTKSIFGREEISI